MLDWHEEGFLGREHCPWLSPSLCSSIYHPHMGVSLYLSLSLPCVTLSCQACSFPLFSAPDVILSFSIAELPLLWDHLPWYHHTLRS
jgi:hypothetical protein